MTQAITSLTTCPYCGVGCGIKATQETNGTVIIKGDDEHPSNFGRLCSKGSALADTVGLEGCLLYPQIKGERTSWDTALNAVANGLSKIIEQHGANSGSPSPSVRL